MLKTLSINKKRVKQSEIITYQPKTFQNSNIVDGRSVITEHPRTSHKLPETSWRIGSNSSLYSDKKREKILNAKNVKNNKSSTCF